MSIDIENHSDLIDHEPGPDCICKPGEIVVRLKDNGLVIDRVWVHNRLGYIWEQEDDR